MVAMGRLADSVAPAPLTVHGGPPDPFVVHGRVHNGPQQPVGVVAGALVLGRQGVVPAPDLGGVDARSGGSRRQAGYGGAGGPRTWPGSCLPGRSGSLATGGRSGEELFSETGVDPDAPTGVGLLVGQPGVGVCLGRKGHRGSNATAL